MQTSSLELGTVPLLQFDAVAHEPPAVLVQVFVQPAAWAGDDAHIERNSAANVARKTCATAAFSHHPRSRRAMPPDSPRGAAQLALLDATVFAGPSVSVPNAESASLTRNVPRTLMDPPSVSAPGPQLPNS